MIRLSIIIPFYNVEPYIEECIRSVYDQDIALSDYEVICIDDCSPDGSRAIVERLQEEYSTLKLLTTPENLRQGGARNMGLGIAQGKYVWFVDSDDYIQPNCLKAMLDLMDKNDLEILKFAFLDQNTYQPTFKYVQYGPCTGSELIFDAPLNALPDQRCCSVCGEIIRRDLIEFLHARFAEKKQYEDDDYMYPLFATAQRTMTLDCAPYVVRSVENSTTRAVPTLTKLLDLVDQHRRILKMEPSLNKVDVRWGQMITWTMSWSLSVQVLKTLSKLSFKDQMKFFYFQGRIKGARPHLSLKLWCAMNSWIAFKILY